MEPFIGQIMLFGFNFAPRGWALCDGSELPIGEYEALFMLIGTTYGGDGTSTFGLPDLRGRIPIHVGKGPSLQRNYVLGEMGGVEDVMLTVSTMPSHVHMVMAASALSGATGTPGPNVTFGATSGPQVFAQQGEPPTAALSNALSLTGANWPHNNMMPTLVANYCIAVDGIYPQFN